MKKLFVCVAAILVACGVNAGIHKVKASQGAQGLDSTINAAQTGDTVLVQEGTYVGNFSMKEGVQVIGGWNGLFKTQKDYATILDGDAKDRVLTQRTDFNVLTIWENLTIQNGKYTAISDPANNLGCGVYLLWNSQLKHCLIQNNSYDGDHCEGGGVAQNKDDHAGDVVLLDCVIKGNTASHGGGVWLRSTAVGCVITENQTTGKHPGGGAHLQWGRLYNCQVTKNHSSEDAGGIRAYGNCKIIGCLVADNTCDVKVAGIAIEGALGELVGNTIVNNKQTLATTDREYCGVRFDSSSDRGNACCNNIIYGNKAGEAVAEQQCSWGIVNYTAGVNSNNAIAGAPGSYDKAKYINISAIGVDSLFTDYANGDYTLAATAPMVDAGYAYSYSYTTDLAGNPRVKGKAVDMGCYETASKYVMEGQDLQKALDDAKKGDTLLVQAGTFVGNFIMRNGVNVSGGWNAEFTEQTQYATILDGDKKDRVLTQQEDFDVLTVWDNVTLQNGQFDKNVSKPNATKGGGVYMLYLSQLKNCLIQNNTYTGSECEGGGVAQDKDDHAGDVVLLNCVIKGNTASHGGGVYLRSTAVGCVITENQTTGTHPAGGAHLQWGRLYNCQVTKNHSSEDAGGIRAYGNCKVIGCLVADNTCDVKVAGIAIEGALGELVGNTIVNNKQALTTTDREYCGVRFDSSSDRGNACCNNIIYGNKAGEAVAEQQCSWGIVNYTAGVNGNNAIAGAPGSYDKAKYINISAIGVDSLFTDYANGDYTLAATAPMINAGYAFAYPYDYDLAGNDRVQKGTVDMGCYESPYDIPVTALIQTKAAAQVSKMVVNGQVVVVKDGVLYNVLGTKL